MHHHHKTRAQNVWISRTMSPSSSKLSQLVSAIKSSDPVRTRALCNDITFDINDAVECDSDGEEDFPLQVALGKDIPSVPFSRKRARPVLSEAGFRDRTAFLSARSLVFSLSLPSKRRKRSACVSLTEFVQYEFVFPSPTPNFGCYLVM